MSSPGSVVTVELPRWPLADRLALAAVLGCAPVVEAVLARYPGAPAGAGVAVAAVLAAALWRQRRRRPRSLEFTPVGDWLRLADGSRQSFRPGTGTRLLGTSVVLHWEAPGHGGSLWLAPADLPRETLRALAVRLVTGR
jgi:hypothetical protein